MAASQFGASATASLAGLAESVVMEGVGEPIRPYPPGRNSDQAFNGVGLPLLQFNHSRQQEQGGYWWWHTPEDTRDKVDARVLKVDTDLYAAALSHLLAAPTFPVSLSAVVERMGSLLSESQEEAGDRFDLSEALARQAELLQVVGRIEASLPSEAGPEVDLALVAVLRPLHRVLYTGLGPYHPDPAVSVGALPGLNAVEMLAANEPDTDRYRFALATLQREGARILEALDEARGEADALLEVLSGR
jgi:hypothetical protein